MFLPTTGSSPTFLSFPKCWKNELLQVHLKQNSLFEKFQSGFRFGHSTEKALVRVRN